MARDLILHHIYGAPVKRGTDDIDFGIQISSWNDFNRIKSALCDVGYSEDKQVQRLLDPRGRIVDMVPFGPLQGESANIGFPPKGDIKMSVLGFQEALDNSIEVVIQEKPHLVVPVVSPPGLVLLKIIAWADRAREKRSKDALDLKYLLESYEKIGDVGSRVYDTKGLMESVDWEMPLAGAFLLGQDAAAIAQNETRAKVNSILTKALDKEKPSGLVSEMGDQRNIDTHFAMLSSFHRGFNAGALIGVGEK